MRQMFPSACYLGFTGTPLLKKEKNNFKKFGELLEPHYSITQAVADGAVVPLLYEGRHVEMTQNQAAVDLWFERHTAGLSKEQQADLKRKYARAEMLNKAEQVIYMRAFDISEHYRASWQGTGFKAQLVAPNKAAALKYYEFLNEIGHVSSEVMISPPDMREGFEETDEETSDEVVKFWDKMIKRYGSEEEYNKQLINQFKHGDDLEIIIVVDKLLTGFDAPRNVVLYLCRVLREHTLLQAIARVNRLYDGKEYGYIVDYASVLGELDKALTMYGAFEGFNEGEISGTLTSIKSEIDQLPGRYSALWDIFKTVKHSYDEEEYELLLADDELRADFYSRLSDYAKNLAIALSSEYFLSDVDDQTLRRYKSDLRKFQKLRGAVKLRYAEAIDDFRAKRISDLDYLNKVSEIRCKVVGKVHDDVPEKLANNDDALAFFGVLKTFFNPDNAPEEELEQIAADTAIAIHKILSVHKKVHFWDDEDAQKQVVNEIDDYLFDEVKSGRGLNLSLDQMDDIIDEKEE